MGKTELKERLEQLLDTDHAGRTLICLDEVDSTNRYLRALAEGGAKEGTLVIAERQTAGKGRMGRTWESAKGTSILMSLLLRPSYEPEQASMLTLVAALAVEVGIRAATGQAAKIKWPNDLVLERKKICGILTEMCTIDTKIQYVIVGIGINVNQTAFPEELRDKATSLSCMLGHAVEREPIVAETMKAWEHYYDIFQKTMDLRALKEEYNQKLAGYGGEVRVLASEGEFTAISRGIMDQGTLLVETAQGELLEIRSGEVSVRGIYGYV